MTRVKTGAKRLGLDCLALHSGTKTVNLTCKHDNTMPHKFNANSFTNELFIYPKIPLAPHLDHIDIVFQDETFRKGFILMLYT